MMKHYHIKRAALITVFILFSVSVFSQVTSIQVLDSLSSEPCVNANVVISGQDNKYIDGGITDATGKISFETDRIVNLNVSFLGYIAYNGRIEPGKNYVIKLRQDLFDVETVVVTGQYKPRPVDKSIYKIDIVDAVSLQQRGVNNLAEALSGETGIRLQVDPSIGTSIELQGMGGENVKYLLDGIPITGRVGGIIDLSQINTENIDHIEIVRGPMSVQYGTSAIAGVINIITKKNNYYRNLLKANSYTDTKGNYNFGLYGSAKRSGHTLTVSGTRNMFQGVDIDLNVDTADADGHDRYMEFKPKRVYNADLEYSFQRDELLVSVKSQYMNTLLRNYSNYIDKVVLAYDADYHTTRSINSISAKNRISENMTWDIVASYTFFGRETDYITSDLYLLTKELTRTTQTVFNNYMTRASLTYAPEEKNFSVSGGWDINIDNGSGDKISDGASIGDYAVFLSSRIGFHERVVLQPGVRVIYNTIYGAPVVPSLNLQLGIIENLDFRLSYARGFRAPSLKELYLDFKDSNHNLSGNTGLKAETTNSYNFSADYKVYIGAGRLKLEPGLFYNNGKDAITLIVTDASSNSATNVNLGGRRTMGAELNTTFTSGGLNLGAGMSRIGETYDEEGEGDYLPVVYYNNYSFNCRYNISRLGLVIMSNLKYYGKTPSLAPVPEEEGGGYYRIYTDPYGDLELTLTKQVWKNRITIIAGGKNLLDNYEGITTGYRDFGEDGFTPVRIRPVNYGMTWFLKLNMKLGR